MAKEKTRAELREEIEQLKQRNVILLKSADEYVKQLGERTDQLLDAEKKLADFDAVANYHKKEAENLRKQVAELDELIKQQNKSNTDLAGKLIDKQNECDRLRETGDMLIHLIRGNIFRLIIEHYRLIIEYNKQGLKK